MGKADEEQEHEIPGEPQGEKEIVEEDGESPLEEEEDVAIVADVIVERVPPETYRQNLTLYFINYLMFILICTFTFRQTYFLF